MGNLNFRTRCLFLSKAALTEIIKVISIRLTFLHWFAVTGTIKLYNTVTNTNVCHSVSESSFDHSINTINHQLPPPKQWTRHYPTTRQAYRQEPRYAKTHRSKWSATVVLLWIYCAGRGLLPPCHVFVKGHRYARTRLHFKLMVLGVCIVLELLDVFSTLAVKGLVVVKGLVLQFL